MEIDIGRKIGEAWKNSIKCSKSCKKDYRGSWRGGGGDLVGGKNLT